MSFGRYVARQWVCRNLNFAMNHGEQYQRKVGRAAVVNPANRFERIVCEDDFAHLENDSEMSEVRLRVSTELISDQSRSIIVENASPDIPFRYSINPYRGCEHGWRYCWQPHATAKNIQHV